ncbi:hypothetical protein BDB00DRAFT_878631 [Zychaea mexicana]|uniref:uncharacterized protein n=1 Tax=Zychaea mexicana TaxID=64656 RepID=UPI0022FDD30D|nr:uncharacterized protein BDB00DRAFT_878631 [Zychaea mexicana]KAI9484623.1 hypothetical protein BDB00DRAFT_878631 [Zychaea mexicana]
MGEVRALNKAMEKEYQERLARIADRYNAPVDALKHLKPPFIRKNTGGFLASTSFRNALLILMHGEVELSSRSFIDDFQHEMITYNRAQIAHNAVDTNVASVPSFATPSSSSTTTATTTIIPSTTTTTATNHSVPAPSLVAAADRSISKKNQHRQAVQQFYGVHIDDNAHMPWKDERMYEDIVMEGWPDIPRDHPSRLSDMRNLSLRMFEQHSILQLDNWALDPLMPVSLAHSCEVATDNTFPEEICILNCDPTVRPF